MLLVQTWPRRASARAHPARAASAVPPRPPLASVRAARGTRAESPGAVLRLARTGLPGTGRPHRARRRGSAAAPPPTPLRRLPRRVNPPFANPRRAGRRAALAGWPWRRRRQRLQQHASPAGWRALGVHNQPNTALRMQSGTARRSRPPRPNPHLTTPVPAGRGNSIGLRRRRHGDAKLAIRITAASPNRPDFSQRRLAPTGANPPLPGHDSAKDSGVPRRAGSQWQGDRTRVPDGE